MEKTDITTARKSLKSMTIKELKAYAAEIRDKIIQNAYNNGGHLASNLGVVELTLALHYVFDIPKDKLIFDVGHQCYTHKLLTGREERFSTMRKGGGISGFPSREESEADAFIAGHAGTAIAAGLGYCAARDRLGEDYEVVSVVGDGALMNGLSLEALVSSAEKPKNFIVVLNDNGMSISKNTSGLYAMLSRMTVGGGYEKFKRAIKKVFGDSFVTRGLIAVRNFLKRILSNHTYLDYIGLKYVGAVDGHDLKKLIATLVRVKRTEQPVLLHVTTKKGKGYKNAEEEAERFHGVSKNFEDSVNAYSSALGEELAAAADEDERIFAITAAMKYGTGLKIFEDKHKDRFADVGICEEYAATFAAGLAVAGLKPVAAVYSTFLQRAYDEILHDVCLQNLGVVFCLDRAGAVGADGCTHQGLYDLSYLCTMPNMSVYAPRNTEELRKLLRFALQKNAPAAIRYPSGYEECNVASDKNAPPEKWEYLTPKGEIYVLAVGPRMLNRALQAAAKNKKLCVVNARSVRPLDTALLDEIAEKPVVTMEENVLSGGFGEQVLGYYAARGVRARVRNMAFATGAVRHASVEEQLENNCLTAERLLEIAAEFERAGVES